MLTKRIAAVENEIAAFTNDFTGSADPQSETPGMVIGVGGSGTKKKNCKCMCRYLQVVRRKNRRHSLLSARIKKCNREEKSFNFNVRLNIINPLLPYNFSSLSVGVGYVCARNSFYVCFKFIIYRITFS